MIKKNQEIFSSNWLDSMEQEPLLFHQVLSEFIDNSITNFNKNKEKNTKKKIKIDIEINLAKDYFKFRDNCFGMNYCPVPNSSPPIQGKVEKSDDIDNCFSFFPTTPREGQNKYGYGMKFALYWIGKDWKVTTNIKNLKKTFVINASLSKALINKDQHVKMFILEKENLNNQKLYGTEIKIWGFSELQKARLPSLNNLSIKYVKGRERKNYLIFLLAERYKLYLKKYLEIRFFFVSEDEENTIDFTLSKKTLSKFIFKYESLPINYYYYDNKSWEEGLRGTIDKIFSNLKEKCSENILEFNNVNFSKRIEPTVFFDKLFNRELVKESFYFKDIGYDGKQKKIKIDLGLISFAQTIENKFITFQAFQGTSFFINKIGITSRPFDHSRSTEKGAGGAFFRVVAEVFLPKDYVEPNKNKISFDNAKKKFILDKINTLRKSTKIEDIAHILTQITKRTKKDSYRNSNVVKPLESKGIIETLNYVAPKNQSVKEGETPSEFKYLQNAKLKKKLRIKEEQEDKNVNFMNVKTKKDYIEIEYERGILVPKMIEGIEKNSKMWNQAIFLVHCTIENVYQALEEEFDLDETKVWKIAEKVMNDFAKKIER